MTTILVLKQAKRTPVCENHVSCPEGESFFVKHLAQSISDRIDQSEVQK